MSESLYIVEEEQNKLEKAQEHMGNLFRDNCAHVYRKNYGLKIMKIIRNVRYTGLNPTESLDVELTPLGVANIKYSPHYLHQSTVCSVSTETKVRHQVLLHILIFLS